MILYALPVHFLCQLLFTSFFFQIRPPFNLSQAPPLLESEEGVKGEGERGMELGERPGTLHIHTGETRVRTRGGHVASMAKKLWCMAATQANPRTRGVRASVRLGGHVWASYGPN
jgi:hypothetical protein